jgi:hypothetical protein
LHRLADHFVVQHAYKFGGAAICEKTITSVTRLNGAAFWVVRTLLKCPEKHVFAHVSRDVSGYFMCVRMMATEDEATKHNFRVIFKSATAGLSFEGSVHSARKSVVSLKKSGRGLFVSTPQMHANFNHPKPGSSEKLRIQFTWVVNRRAI